MKRILFVLTIALGFQLVNAQDYSVSPETNFNNLKKKVAKSDAEIQDPKKSVNPKTWFSRGELMQEAFEVNNTKLLRKDLPANQLKIFMRDPIQVETKQLPDGSKEEKYIYYGLNVTLKNDMVTDWEETKTVVDDPLDKAYEAYNKTIQLDADKKFEKKLKKPLEELKDQYKRLGIYYFEKEKYSEAYKSFDHILALDEMPMISTQDTIIMYYAGIAAYLAKDYKAALVDFEKAKALNFPEPRLYYYFEQIYLESGDTTKALNAIKEGYSKNPKDNLLVIEMVNLYIKINEAKSAIEYLNKAKALDPTNKTLYFAEGSLWDKLDNADSAKIAYENALKIDPMYFDATYNLGVLYYNQAVKMYDLANKESETKAYLEKKTKADDELKQAVPYMEKAHEINPKDVSTMQTLKTLYYRLKMQDKLQEIKKELGE